MAAVIGACGASTVGRPGPLAFLRRSLRLTSRLWPLAFVRVLMGKLFLGTAWHWLTVADRGQSLTNQVAPLLESGRPAGWYQPFIEGVVLDSPVLFATLVTAGEAFVAVSLILGLMTRAGAAVAMLLTLNYSLLYGQSLLTASGNPLMFWVAFLIMASAAGRAFGVDYWLSRRWRRPLLW